MDTKITTSNKASSELSSEVTTVSGALELLNETTNTLEREIADIFTRISDILDDDLPTPEPIPNQPNSKVPVINSILTENYRLQQNITIVRKLHQQIAL